MNRVPKQGKDRAARRKENARLRAIREQEKLEKEAKEREKREEYERNRRERLTREGWTEEEILEPGDGSWGLAYSMELLGRRPLDRERFDALLAVESPPRAGLSEEEVKGLEIALKTPDPLPRGLRACKAEMTARETAMGKIEEALAQLKSPPARPKTHLELLMERGGLAKRKEQAQKRKRSEAKRQKAETENDASVEPQVVAAVRDTEAFLEPEAVSEDEGSRRAKRRRG